jgi:crotonobetaine/carnitine-CoA ligase
VNAVAALQAQESPWGEADEAIGVLLRRRAEKDGSFIYCRHAEGELSITALEEMSNRIANALSARGIRPGSRVATMLGNSLDHIGLLFALAKRGMCQIPVNIHLRGEGLTYIIANCECDCLIAEAELSEVLGPVLADLEIGNVFWRGGPAPGGEDFAVLRDNPDASPAPLAADPDAVIYICYTSGTTGLPKGVMMTDRMLRVAAWAAGRAGAPHDGDVYHLWTPFYHIGGCEILILGLQRRVTLALMPRFSVSRFWDEVRESGATHMQFLGGVLALLLNQPPSPRDREHRLRIAFGGGCPEPVWRAFEERFGVLIRECYGLTECSSFAAQNLTGKVGSVGPALPWLDITLVDEEGHEVGPGERDAEGDIFYLGRKKDSLRRRGENIAAYEVERLLNQHPDVEESAIIGVPNELQDEDIKAVLRLREGASLNPLDLIRWCEGRMAYFQIPRFIAIVEEFPRTPSQRIRKELLLRDVADCWDLEKSGYRLRR